MFGESEWGPRTTVTQLIFTCSKSIIETLENEIRSKLTIKTPEPHRRSGVFIVNFELGNVSWVVWFIGHSL